ncbi:50S ribosome-binding GTPase [Microlunatus aurantiacus]|uniref:50S ribosome-binding GTPase n=1 Tax=Microlunatus aurantiacus TaxID=446786 RepID=A0ABP7CMD2_9ACTN
MAVFGRRARPDDATGVADRVRALAEAADACRGRVPDEVITEAERVATQVDRRLAFSGSATVVALAGATGSGKSSLFNALSGTELARVGVTRPTTSEPLAVTWGDEPTEDLLDWLQVSRRHALPSGTGSTGSASVDGLILLDLPDHDSTEKSNQLQVDRLVQLVDVLVWVVDPQKYADAVLHERYLRPLVEHAPVMTVVLNQVDRLSRTEREACLRDLRRLLDSEGLQRTTIQAVSAETGEGLAELRELLGGRVADKLAAARRLAADVSTAADRLASASGDAAVPELSRRNLETMNTAMAEAAGARVVGDAVRDAWRVRGAAATGWPVVAWIGRLKPDPLRRLHLDRLSAGTRGSPKEIDPTGVGRTSLPTRSGVQQARVDTAVRDLAAEASGGLTRGWTDAVKAAARSQESRLPDALDRAVARTDLDVDRRRRWWQVVRVLQWLLLAAVVAGLLWLAAAFVLAYLQLPPLPPVTWGRLPAPTVLVLGGVLAGLLLGGLSRIGVVVGASRRERAARAALRRSVTVVTDELVVQPVRGELDRYARARAALSRASAR